MLGAVTLRKGRGRVVQRNGLLTFNGCCGFVVALLLPCLVLVPNAPVSHAHALTGAVVQVLLSIIVALVAALAAMTAKVLRA